MKLHLPRWACPAYGAVLFIAYAAITLAHGSPPLLGDFPNWVYQGNLLVWHLQGLPDPTHQLKHYPVPNSTATVLLGLLSLLLPWLWAAKVFICLQLASAWFAIRQLSTAARTEASTAGWIWLIAPGAFFLNINFWYGLISFQLGLALLFIFLARFLKTENQTRSKSAGQAALLVLLFFTHMVPFTFACLVLACHAALCRSLRGLIVAVPGMALSCWYVAGRFLGGNPDTATALSPGFGGIGPLLLFKANTVLKSFGYVNPGDFHDRSAALTVEGIPLFAAVFLLAMVVAVAVVWMEYAHLQAWWRSYRNGAALSQARTAIHLAILLAVPVYLLLPRSMLGISDPGARVLQIALYAALFFVDTESVTLYAATAGSVLQAAVGLTLFVTLGFSNPPVPAEKILPTVMERFALVPYTQMEGSYDLLHGKDPRSGVFPTGLFVNRPQK